MLHATARKLFVYIMYRTAARVRDRVATNLYIRLWGHRHIGVVADLSLFRCLTQKRILFTLCMFFVCLLSISVDSVSWTLKRLYPTRILPFQDGRYMCSLSLSLSRS